MQILYLSQGCTKGEHSNVKPAEPEKQPKKNIPDIVVCFYVVSILYLS